MQYCVTTLHFYFDNQTVYLIQNALWGKPKLFITRHKIKLNNRTCFNERGDGGGYYNIFLKVNQIYEKNFCYENA